MKQSVENSTHWSKQKEKTTGLGVKFMLFLFKKFPVTILRVIAFSVGLFYFVFSKSARKESRRFLEKAALCTANNETAKKCRRKTAPLRHIVSFSLTLIEKMETWGGRFPFDKIHFQQDDVQELIDNLNNGKGVFIITSHLGNIELLRGLASFNKTGVKRATSMTAIMDLKVTENFSNMLNELNPDSSLDIINAKDIGVHTSSLLEEKLKAGEIITIAGDRTGDGSAEKKIMIPFLGEDAPFSPGMFYLTSIIDAPVYFIFALRRGELSINPEYDMHVHKAEKSFSSSKKERLAQSERLARYYAKLLEDYCKEQPFQWYNFYNFWSKGV